MGIIVMDWSAYNTLTDTRRLELHECTGIRLGTVTKLYAVHDTDGNGVEPPYAVLWSHRRIGWNDVATVGLVAADRTRLQLKTRPDDPDGTPTNKPNPIAGERRSRADIRYAVQWKNRVKLAALAAKVAGLSGDVSPWDEAVKVGSPTVDDGRKNRG